jgi:hypothetical protein
METIINPKSTRATVMNRWDRTTVSAARERPAASQPTMANTENSAINEVESGVKKQARAPQVQAKSSMLRFETFTVDGLVKTLNLLATVIPADKIGNPVIPNDY